MSNPSMANTSGLSPFQNSFKNSILFSVGTSAALSAVFVAVAAVTGEAQTIAQGIDTALHGAGWGAGISALFLHVSGGLSMFEARHEMLWNRDVTERSKMLHAHSNGRTLAGLITIGTMLTVNALT